jgi:hypothetical protein
LLSLKSNYDEATNFISYFKYSEAVTQCDVTQQVHEAPHVFNMYGEKY